MQYHHGEYGNNILGNEQEKASQIATERFCFRIPKVIIFRLIDIEDAAESVTQTKYYQDENKHAYFFLENICLLLLLLYNFILLP